MTATGFALYRDAIGRLVFARGDEVHVAVVPVRAFAITAPDEGIALVSAEGHELLWLPGLSALPDDMRALLEDELAGRDFMPEIRRIRHVSGYVTPCRWDVDTDRGAVSFMLKAEDDVRRIGAATLLISDSHGVQYLVRDRQALDKASRRLLQRFM